MAAAKKPLLRKGQHMVCKYGLAEGKSNGDQIVARVESVRSNGKVHLTNLLAPGGKDSIKQMRVLMKRNQPVPKKEAMKIVKIFQEKGYHPAREAAVKLAERFSPTPKRKCVLPATVLPVPEPQHPPLFSSQKEKDAYNSNERVRDVIIAYNELDAQEKQRFAKAVWKDALVLLGVE